MKAIIRYAKTAAILIAVSAIVTACPWGNPMPEEEPNRTVAIKRDCYALGYWDIETQFPALSYFEKDGRIAIDCSVIHGIEIGEWRYVYWNRCKYKYDRDPDSEFRKLAEHYGDTDYKKFGKRINALIVGGLLLVDNAPTSFNKVITAIDITSNTAWDENHEAGVSLADCFNISYTTFAKYIDSGYAKDKLQTVDEIIMKPLNELTSDNLRLVNVTPLEHSLTLTAAVPQTSTKSHNLTIVFTLEDGSTRESTITVEFP